MDPGDLITWTNAISGVAASLGIIPLVLYCVKYAWDRRRWHAFEALIRQWAHGDIHHKELTDEEWKSLAAILLGEAGFEPARVKELLEVGNWLARGRASQAQGGWLESQETRE